MLWDFRTHLFVFLATLCVSVVFPVFGSEPSGPNPGNLAPSGSQSVSLFTGAFTYTYPIVIPPGRKGIQPDLNLIYNSQATNGWLGVGWDLSIGSIHRSTKNGLPTYNDSLDTFIFNFQGQSQQLVQISTGSDTYGSYNEYRAQIESGFMLFRYYAPSHWRVWSKDGTKYSFQGLGLNPANNTYSYWGLSASTDTVGNYMQVTYQTVASNLSYLPTEIDYTGNTVQNIGATNQALFSFESRPDILTSFASAYGQQITQRLKTIQLKSNGSIVRTYNLNYSTSNSAGYSLLASLTLTGSDDASLLPATTFYYSDASGFQFSSWNSSTITNPTNYGVLSAGDFNSDGITDLVYYPAGQNSDYNLYVGISNGQNALSYSSWGAANHGIDSTYLQVSDLNGDGYDDVYTTDGTKAYIEKSDGSSFSQISMTDNSIVPREDIGTGNFTSSTGGSFATYVSGNGTYFSDVFWVCLVPPLCNSRNVTNTLESSTQFGPFGIRTWGAGDFNGDGTSDTLLLWAQDNVFRVGINDGAGISYSTWAANPADFTTSAQTLRVGDFNGDGLSDIVMYSKDSEKIYVGISTGTAFSTSTWATVNLSTTALATFRVGDFNGDGLADIAYFDGDHTTWVGLSDGGQFNITAWDTSPLFTADTAINSFIVGDYNGDGKSDIAAVTKDLKTWVGISSGPAVNLLTQVTNSLSASITVQYQNAYRSGMATDVPFPIQVVQSVTTSDSMGSSVATSYSYSGGLYQDFPWSQREFLGFQQVTSSDSLGNYTVTQFMQNQDDVSTDYADPFKGKIAEQDIYNSSATLMTKTVNTYSYVSPYTGVYFPFLSQTDSYIDSKQSEMQYQYDGYGNLTQEYDIGDVSVNGDERRTITDYSTTSLSGYLVGYPTHNKMLDASSSTVSETWIAYDTNTIYTQAISSGLPTRVENWLSGSTDTVVISSYDAYGNMTDQYDALWNATSGMEGNHTQYAYDPVFHQFLSTSTQAVGSLNLVETFIFDPFTGQVSSHTDVNNQTTQYQYDVFGRLAKVINSSDTISLPTLSYDYNINSTGPPHSIVSHARIVTGSSATLDTYTFFDGVGRKRETKVTGSSGAQIVSDFVDYDARGLISNAYVPYTVTASTSFVTENTSIPKSTMTYDGLGRITSVVAPDGSTTTTSYQNWSQTVTDANGHVKDFTKDAYGRILLVNEHNQGLTQGTTYQYDTLGNLTQIVNSLGSTTTLTYDTLSRKTAINDPQMGAWAYQYDPNGNLLLQTDAKGQTIQMTYDRINRLASKIYPDSTTLTYQYDSGDFGKGRLSQVADLSGYQTFYYDNLGRVTQKARLMGSTTYYTQMSYDDTGRETSVTYPNGNTVQSYFDGVFLSSAQDVQNGTIYAAMKYDASAVGKISSIVYGSSITVSYTYKPNNFYLNTLISTTSTNQTLQNFSYGYDNVGNITSIGDSAGGMNQTFQYDDLNRVAVSSGPYGYRTYQYDSFGNLTFNSDNTSGSWGFEDLSLITTVQGTPTLVNGRLGTGLNLDGATVVQLSSSSRLSPTAAMSIELWVRPLVLGTTGYLMSKPGEFYFPKLNADGSLDAQLSLSSGSTAVHVSSGANYNVWSHLMMTYDGSAVKVYVNGVFQSSQTAYGTILPSTNSVVVGSGFTGIVDEINFHSRAISSQETLLRYQAAPDMTPNQPFAPAPTAVGMLTGGTNVSYGFSFQAYDLDGDSVSYRIDWATGAVTYPQTAYVPSGTVVVTSNTWTQAGQYNIRYEAVTLPAGTTTEIVSSWSPTYNVFIGTAITTQLGGPLLIGAEGGVSQSASYISSNTVGEWIVSRSTSAIYQSSLGYQSGVTSTSSMSELVLGSQGAGGTETSPPTKLSTGIYTTPCYTEVMARGPNQPFTPAPTTAGMLTGGTNNSYGFSFQAYDLDGDSVSYRIDWGTGAVAYPQTAYVPSGTVVITSNTWPTAGQYNIRYAAVAKPGGGSEVVSAWSPAYNVYIGTAITTQLSGSLLIGAEGGVSQSSSYISSNTAGEWIVSKSTSINYQAFFGYQQPITSSSTLVELSLGSQGTGGGPAGPPELVITFVVNAPLVGQGLAQQGYAQIRDANGNLTLGGNRWTSYDYENRPVCVVTPDQNLTRYLYDFEGNRTAQIITQSTTTFISSSTYIGQIYEIDGSTTIQYITAGSLRVAMKDGDGNVTYILPDHLGGTNLLVSPSQGTVRTNKYDPFGGFFSTTGTQDSDYKFTGQRYDSQPGIYYYGARYYDPLLSQFITPDKIIQNSYDPQTLNRFSYCRNNPLRLVDPTGNSFWGDVGRFFDKNKYYIAAAVITVATYGAGSEFAAESATLEAASDSAATIDAGVASGLGSAAATYASGASIAQGALTGEILGGVSTGLSGGSGRDVLLGTVIQGAEGGAEAGLLHEIDTSGWKWPEQVLAKGTVGGTFSEISGGSFLKGFAITAGASIADLGYQKLVKYPPEAGLGLNVPGYQYDETRGAPEGMNVIGNNNGDLTDQLTQGGTRSQILNAAPALSINATADFHDDIFKPYGSLAFNGWSNYGTMIPAFVFTHAALLGGDQAIVGTWLSRR